MIYSLLTFEVYTRKNKNWDIEYRLVRLEDMFEELIYKFSKQPWQSDSFRNAGQNRQRGLFKSPRDRTWNSAKDDKITIESSTRPGHYFSSSQEKVKTTAVLRKGVLPHIPLVIHQPGYWKCHVDHRATWFQLAVVVCALSQQQSSNEISLSVSSEIGNSARDWNFYGWGRFGWGIEIKGDEGEGGYAG
jgi:hypothetical protein